MDFRTDLAVERSELTPECPGVEKEEREFGDCRVTKIKITSEQAQKAMGKPIGTYVTVDVKPFSSDAQLLDGRLDALTEEISKLLTPDGSVLVAGLGNMSMTADALGPECTNMIFVTRHIKKELAEAVGLRDMRSVACIAPSVLGKTGVETSEIIRGVCDNVKPSCVVVIDALAAMDIKRLGTTVQISDTGIFPGSGVGNSRQEISERTLGVKVISIGIPTVINAYTLTRNVLDSTGEHGHIDISSAKMYSEYVVASREADLITSRGARLISLALNCALQPSLTASELLTLS